MILRTAAFVFICCSITQKNVAGDNLEKIISNFYEDCIEGIFNWLHSQFTFSLLVRFRRVTGN